MGIEKEKKAIGKEVVWGGNGTRLWTVVGVVGDFHQESLKNPMEPMIFRPVFSTYGPASIKFQSDNRPQLVAGVEATFGKFFPDNSFEYSFLEDSYKRQYDDDNRFGKVVSIFTLLAIVISCLGLIGLSSYTAVQRTKEIGIRKVLGASLVNIISLLSMNFMKLVVIATLFSVPIAFFGVHNWLEGYAYRITLGWPLFVAPVFVILLIASITISFQVLKTATTNPAETLKYE